MKADHAMRWSQTFAIELSALLDEVAGQPLGLRTGYREDRQNGVTHVTCVRRVEPGDPLYLHALAEAINGQFVAGRRIRAYVRASPEDS